LRANERRSAARCGWKKGLLPSGFAMSPASSAACPIVSSESGVGTAMPNGPGFKKKRSLADCTPYAPCPK